MGEDLIRQTQPTDSNFGQDQAYELGYDELNLAEFPLASISHRFLDGTKTVVLDDQVWDREKRAFVERRLTISGSDRYGLPTAVDDDVLLACIQLSGFGKFSNRRVEFSRYELLKLLRWKDETKNYRRLSTSLRRWKGLSVFSNRAFYDKARQSWVNRDFGVFDNLVVYEKEIAEGKSAPASSWFIWNEVIFESFQAGYLKRFDWQFYLTLESPVAKRLYRFLDKRFYHGSTVEIDLMELAVRKVRISSSYNVAQMKRELIKGIQELEHRWTLVSMPAKDRFQKVAPGKWKVVIESRQSSRTGQKIELANKAQCLDLVAELTKRQIGPGTADQLVLNADPQSVKRMIDLYDWYNKQGNNRGPGFLVSSIKNPERITMPVGFGPAKQRPERNPINKSRISLSRELRRSESSVSVPRTAC
jgi:Replication initiator protein A